MSFKRNLSSLVAVAAGVVIFAAGTLAQDTTTPTTERKAGEHQFKGGREGRKNWEGRKGEHGKMGGRRGPGLRGLFRDLNLTDAQKAQIKQIHEANKPTGENFEAIHTLMKAKRDGTITADQEAQLKAFHAQRKAKAKSVHEQILAVLTSEQRAQLDQRRNEMKQKREEFKKNRELRRQQRQTGAPKVS